MEGTDGGRTDGGRMEGTDGGRTDGGRMEGTDGGRTDGGRMGRKRRTDGWKKDVGR